MRAAARREIDLLPIVLAKLMVLDEQFPEDFQRLFDWQQAAGGPAPELKLAEEIAVGIHKVGPNARVDASEAKASQKPAKKAAKKAVASTIAASASDRTTTEKSDEAADAPKTPPVDPDLEAAANQWATRPPLAEWLRLDPRLGDLDLRSYFSYFRDRIVVGSVASALSLKLQTLVSRILQEENPRIRRAVIDGDLKSLPPEDQQAVLSAVLDAVTRAPDSSAFRAAAEVGGRVPSLGATVCEMFRRIPHQSLGAGRLLNVLAQLKDVEGWDELVADWKASDVQAVSRVAAIAGRDG